MTSLQNSNLFYAGDMKKYIFASVASSFLLAGVAFAALYQASPTVCSGNWMTCSNAYASDDTYSEGSAGGVNSSGIWTGYVFGLPGGATVSKVEVGVEGKEKKVGALCNGTATVDVAISNNGGTSFGPNHTVTLACNDSLTWIDVTADVASSSWTVGSLSSTSFQVRAVCTNRTCLLDHLPAQVTTL